MAVSGGAADVAFLACLIVFYSVGTAVLQAGFQRGGALTIAGLATLLTNALPIAAGMLIFNEPFPRGWVGAVRVVAFAAVICGAFLLSTRTKAAQPRPTRAEPEVAVSPT
jgi:drug/metabolite transporter (DMT)-like permease